ncbi:MAG: HD domain-containing protein [Candidatus Omnitrophica bacterium]|nr:HD domain-containing protein [Candidatus Omnitrophota bacterium]
MTEYNLPNENEDIFLTPNQAAKILNISLATFKKFIYQGKIKTLKTPGGHHRILKKDLLSMTNESIVCDLSDELTKKNVNDIVDELLENLKNRRKFCKAHDSSVAEISLKIAKKMNFSSEQMNHLRMAALLHDIGFLGISETILHKSDQLSKMDYFVVKTHPLIGEEILNAINRLKELSPIIRQHHERYDGKGYPDGLAKKDICREARIIALAEAFDSMTAEDSYRKPLSRKAALDTIEKEAGKQFDPEVVKIFSENCKGQ